MMSFLGLQAQWKIWRVQSITNKGDLRDIALRSKLRVGLVYKKYNEEGEKNSLFSTAVVHRARNNGSIL